MTSPTVLLLMRIVHVFVGVFWAGAVLFIAGFLFPSVRAAGPAGGQIMQQLTLVRRMPVWLMGAAVLTLLSGFGLYWHDGMVSGSAWFGSGPGKVFGLGGLLALAAAVLGMAVNSPTAKRLGALMGAIQAAGRAPSADELAEARRLQARLGTATLTVAILVGLATLAMAIARYVA